MTQEIARRYVDGEWVTDVEAQGGSNGGSQPGIVTRKILDFQETAGAGTYTATIDVAAGTVVLDMIAYLFAAFAAATVTLDASDGSADYFTAIDPAIAFGDVYANTGGAAAMGAGAINPKQVTSSSDYGETTYMGEGTVGGGIIYDAPDTITVTVVTTGAGGTTGHLQVHVLLSTPVTPVDAVKS